MNKPARIRVRAPNMIVNLFTTFVIATRPTFCENDVIGGHPNTPPETADINPSHASDPDTSRSVMLRPSPPVQTAVVSPIVSAAETRNTRVTETIAPMSNLGVKRNRWGNEMNPNSLTVAAIESKLTI